MLGNPRRLITAATVINQKRKKRGGEGREKKGEKKVRKKKIGEKAEWVCGVPEGLHICLFV